MDLIARRFRGVLIAIVVLGLSAGAVFAGHVVLQATATAPTASEQGDQNEDADENANDAPETQDGDAAGAHGALVSQAARMDTPTVDPADPFKNHGEFVSCVAHVKSLPLGVDATTFLSTLTPTICAQMATAEEQATEDATETEDGTKPTDNHGALVSRAAQMPTPAGFANHGAFVSCVAHMKDVTDAAAFDFSTVTPESCAAADAARAAEKAAAKADRLHGKAGKHGKGHNRS